MKYNLANHTEVLAAQAYLSNLALKESICEITKVSPRRSLNQNAYLHLLLGAFGNHFGYTLNEAKYIYKELNATIYAYKKNNRTFYRSSADLTKEEMAISIDKFMEASAKQGYALPPATDLGWLMQIENEIERSKQYL